MQRISNRRAVALSVVREQATVGMFGNLSVADLDRDAAMAATAAFAVKTLAKGY